MTISIEYLFKKKTNIFFIRKFKRIYIPFFDSMTPVDSFVFNAKEKFPLKYYLPINFHCKILVLGWFSIGVVGIFLIANESSNKRETYCRNCTNLASKKSHKTTTVFNTNKTIKKSPSKLPHMLCPRRSTYKIILCNEIESGYRSFVKELTQLLQLSCVVGSVAKRYSEWNGKETEHKIARKIIAFCYFTSLTPQLSICICSVSLALLRIIFFLFWPEINLFAYFDCKCM